MGLFRRRSNPPSYSDYRKYKKLLREDFCYCCVYCSLHENENGGPRNFHIDHYKPKSTFPELKTTYENLLYACSVCNSYKLDDWPSDDPLNEGIGYLDPCTHDYDEHFAEVIEFKVEGKSSAAKYMVERLHLNRRYLIKIRRLRNKAEKVYQKASNLDTILKEIQNILRDKVLPEELTTALQTFIQTAREQYVDDMQNWEKRQEPLFDLSDYT